MFSSLFFYFEFVKKRIVPRKKERNLIVVHRKTTFNFIPCRSCVGFCSKGFINIYKFSQGA